MKMSMARGKVNMKTKQERKVEVWEEYDKVLDSAQEKYKKEYDKVLDSVREERNKKLKEIDEE